MDICRKIVKFTGMILGAVAGILVLFGVIGFFMLFLYEASFLRVENYWNYLYTSVPFSLLAICCTLFVIAGKDKK